MNAQTRREIRFGLIALALSGLLFVVGIVLRGPVDLVDPGSCCRAPLSPVYVEAWVIILAGGVLHLWGVFGLYRYLSYRTESLIVFLGLVLRTAESALFLTLPAFFSIDVPVVADLYRQGNQEVIAVVEAHFTSGLGAGLLGVMALVGIIGMSLFAIAIWRDGRLPKWTAILLWVSLPLLAFPVTFATELLGGVLMLISASVIGRKGWQESGTAVGA